MKEDENRRKGEMVLIVEGFKAQEEALPADALRTLALLQAELPLKKAAALAAEIHGVKKNALYKYALEQQGVSFPRDDRTYLTQHAIISRANSVLPG